MPKQKTEQEKITIVATDDKEKVHSIKKAMRREISESFVGKTVSDLSDEEIRTLVEYFSHEFKLLDMNGRF